MQDEFNVIFLDVDGVLNNYASRKHKEIANFHSKIFSEKDFIEDDFNFDPKCLEALNELITSLTNPKIVISSDWRFHTSPRHFHEMFEVVGVKYTPIDLTGYNPLGGNDQPRTRSKRIMEYVNSHDHIRAYCAIDDRKDLFEEDFTQVVFTDPHTGLTDEDVKKVLEKLSHEPKKSSPETK